MRKIAIINQKGGVGKTTTTVNLAAALALAGRRVCVIDMDPQAHASTHLGVELDGTVPSLYNVLVSGRPMAEVRRPVGENLTLVPADINLAAAEVELAGVVGREVILREALAGMIDSSSSSLGDGSSQPLNDSYDYLLMDCGPSLGVLTINALATADEVFIPLQPHFLALHGLSKLLETTALVARRINPQLVVTGVVVCLYDATTKLAQEVVADLHTFLSRSRGSSVPWASAKVFNTKIRRNIKLAECPSFGQNIFAYAPKSTGAADYAALAMEVMGDSSPLRVETARLKVETPVPVVSRQTTVQPVV
jgi:chromosome partitioning protein